MNIAYIITSLDKKGPVYVTNTLIDAIKTEPGINIDVYYLKDIVGVDMGVPCYKIKFFDKIDFDKYDVIHSTTFRADLYVHINKRNIKGKKICSLHGYLEEFLPLTYKQPISKVIYCLWTWALSSFDLIICSTDNMKKYYEKIIPKTEKTTIYYGINDLPISDINNEDKEKIITLKKQYKIIGTVCLLIKRKGLHQLVKFLSHNKEYAVVIVGDGCERNYLEKLALKLNVANRLLLLGFRDNSKNYYSFFDIYSVTSYSEGFTIALIEAMSAGLPIVSSKIAAFRDVLLNDDVAYFDLDNMESFSNAIKEIEKKREIFSNNSRKKYERFFSKDVMKKKMLDAYFTTTHLCA